MTVPVYRAFPVISLFGRRACHSSVPARVRIAGARSDGQEPALRCRSEERRLGQCTSVSPLAGARAMVALRSLRAILCFVTIFVSSMLLNGAAYAERMLSPPHRASNESFHLFAAIVTEASRRFGVPERWIRAVMQAESGGRQRARSPKGAMGLMQIMPKTWTELRARHGLGADPFDPRDNILAGAAYIRELHDRYGAPGFFAAYNAGPGRYERHLATERPL